MKNKNDKTVDALREREREHSLEWRLLEIDEKYSR